MLSTFCQKKKIRDHTVMIHRYKSTYMYSEVTLIKDLYIRYNREPMIPQPIESFLLSACEYHWDKK